MLFIGIFYEDELHKNEKWNGYYLGVKNHESISYKLTKM